MGRERRRGRRNPQRDQQGVTRLGSGLTKLSETAWVWYDDTFLVQNNLDLRLLAHSVQALPWYRPISILNVDENGVVVGTRKANALHARGQRDEKGTYDAVGTTVPAKENEGVHHASNEVNDHGGHVDAAGRAHEAAHTDGDEGALQQPPEYLRLPQTRRIVYYGDGHCRYRYARSDHILFAVPFPPSVAWMKDMIEHRIMYAMLCAMAGKGAQAATKEVGEWKKNEWNRPFAPQDTEIWHNRIAAMYKTQRRRYYAAKQPHSEIEWMPTAWQREATDEVGVTAVTARADDCKRCEALLLTDLQAMTKMHLATVTPKWSETAILGADGSSMKVATSIYDGVVRENGQDHAHLIPFCGASSSLSDADSGTRHAVAALQNDGAVRPCASHPRNESKSTCNHGAHVDGHEMAGVHDDAFVHFDSVLCNMYVSGKDHIMWHSDSEKLYCMNGSCIASLTLAAPKQLLDKVVGCSNDDIMGMSVDRSKSCREFQLRRKERPTERYSIPLASGSLLIMGGSTQSEFQHSVPKRGPSVDHICRVNYTFRCVAHPQLA